MKHAECLQEEVASPSSVCLIEPLAGISVRSVIACRPVQLFIHLLENLHAITWIAEGA